MLPLSSISKILLAVWVDKESKGLEKLHEEIPERNSSETEDFDITHLQSRMIKDFYIIFWHLRPPCSPINSHISDRILNNLEARADCSLLRFQADMHLGLLEISCSNSPVLNPNQMWFELICEPAISSRPCFKGE
jgi:hypothetical protein